MKIVSIIGQKNVGKSSLFNYITKSSSSTGINYSGYTRDCVFADIKIGTAICRVFDTPGLGCEKNEIDFIALKYAWRVIKESDMIIFLFDMYSNFSLDKKIFSIISKFNGKKIYVMNKSDLINDSNKYINNGLTEKIFNISVKCKSGINEFLLYIRDNLSTCNGFTRKNDANIKVIILGKPNAGKSSLFNKLSNSDSSLVYNMPGTTRDFISGNFFLKNKSYIIIDTPGVKINNLDSLDNLHVCKISDLVKNSDIVFYVLNINDKISKQDFFLINHIISISKAIVLILNKADMRCKAFISSFYVNNLFNYGLTRYIPYRFVSSKYGFGIKNIFEYLKFMEDFKIKFDFKNVIDHIRYFSSDRTSIKKIKVLSYYPFIIDIYSKEKISYNDKKYISSFFIKNSYFGVMPIKFKFRQI